MGVSDTNIKSQISYFLGYGFTDAPGGDLTNLVANIYAQALDVFTQAIQSPLGKPWQDQPHRWSWLRGTTSVVIDEPVTFSQDGAAGFKLHSNVSGEQCPAIANGVLTLGLDSTTEFNKINSGTLAWIKNNRCIIKISGIGSDVDGYHTPTAVTMASPDVTVTLKDTSLTVAEADVTTVTGGVQSGVSFTFYNVFADVPTDTNERVNGYMTHQANSGEENVDVINIGALRDMYAREPIFSDAPRFVAYDPTKTEFQFYPLPDKKYVLDYEYQSTSIQTSNIDPKYEGVILLGAMAIAENFTEGPSTGEFRKQYENALKTAILEDRYNFDRETYYGVNEDRSEIVMPHGRKTDRSSIYYTNRSGTKFPS